MEEENILSVLDPLVHFIEKQGAEGEVFGVKRNEIIVTIERNDIKLCIKQYTTGVGIRTFIKNSIGFSSCNSLSKDITRKTAEKAVNMSRKTPPVPYSGVADPGSLPDITGLYDPSIETFDEQTAIAKAQQMIEVARKDPRISVDSGEFSVVVREKAICTSSGISAAEKKSRFSWFLICLAREKGEVGSYSYQYGCTAHQRELYMEETAQSVAENAVLDLHSQKIESFKGDLILGPDAVSNLICTPLIFALNANNVYREQSGFAEKTEERVASDIVTVQDNSCIPGDFDSSAFDREGTPHQQVTMIDNGILKTFMYDSLAAHREARHSTGNASGTFREIPKIDIASFIIEKGSHNLDSILKETDKGLLVRRFSGTSDQISGDFSGAVKEAQLIASGEVQHSVKEATIGGNVFKILPTISDISVETLRYPKMILPYIKIPDIQFTV